MKAVDEALKKHSARQRRQLAELREKLEDLATLASDMEIGTYGLAQLYQETLGFSEPETIEHSNIHLKIVRVAALIACARERME